MPHFSPYNIAFILTAFFVLFFSFGTVFSWPY